MDKCTYSPGDDQPPVRRFGKQPLSAILALSDADFERYIRDGDDLDLYRLEDLEATVQDFAHRMGTGWSRGAPTRGQAQPEPRVLYVEPR